jgi:small subunit ribosomal protein S4
MARYTGAVCRLCRREETKLFLKGERCYTDKCAFDRRGYPPGQHGQRRRRKPSDYGEQLREKQKVKRMYGLAEKQFKNYFFRANQMKGVTGENLLILLERRLDNVIYRLGLAGNRSEARQLLLHRHFTVNGKRVNIPSFLIDQGDVVEVREPSRKVARISEALSGLDRRGLPAWLELEKENYKGKIVTLPTREDIVTPIREQLIVELYSK